MRITNVKGIIVKTLAVALVAGAAAIATPAQAQGPAVVIGFSLGHPVYAPYAPGYVAYGGERHEDWERHEAFERQQAWERQQAFARHEAFEHRGYGFGDRDRGYDRHFDGDRHFDTDRHFDGDRHFEGDRR